MNLTDEQSKQLENIRRRRLELDVQRQAIEDEQRRMDAIEAEIMASMSPFAPPTARKSRT